MEIEEEIAHYEAQLAPDPNNLTESLIRQSPCMNRVCELLAEYRRRKRNQSVAVKRLEAKVADRFRSKSGRHTDAAVTSAVDKNDIVVEGRKKYNRLCWIVERLEGLRDSFIQRSFVLKDLVEWLQSDKYNTDSLPVPKKKKRIRSI